MTQAFDCEFVYKNNLGNKNLEKKALIPLPPTGFVLFFCANGRRVQSVLPTRPAAGSRGRYAFSRCVRLCDKMQWLRTASD